MINLVSNIKPDIAFHYDGLIEISAKVCVILNIEPGDIINIFNEDGEYYLYIEFKNPAGTFKGRCRKAKRTSRYMRLNWVELSRKILSGVEKAYYRVGLPIEVDNKKVLPIITRNNLYDKRN